MDKEHSLHRIASLLFLIINLSFLLVFFRTLSSFQFLFKSLSIKTSAFTSFVLYIRYLFFPLAIILISKEYIKDKERVFVINAWSFTLILAILIPLFIVGVLIPASHLR